MPARLSPRALVRARLARQFLVRPGPERASEVVRALGAVQAQDYAGASWALALRTPRATAQDVERELTDGRILRTHVLRPTWHFVAPADIRWMLALTAPRVKAAMAYHDRTFGVTPAVCRRSHAAIEQALAGGRQLTRAELARAIEDAGVPIASGQRLAGLVMRAELDALICSGARRGRQSTYALLEERVPPAPALAREEALLRLARIYFSTRGPATARDFAWWSGLTVADAKHGIALAAGQLDHARLDGVEYWFAGDIPRRTPPTAHLLPNYDEYFIGYRDRTAVGGRLGHTRPVTGGNALISNVAFVDGQLVGGWKRTLDAGAVVIHLTLQARLTAAERRRLSAAARRFGAFLSRPVAIRE